MAPILPFQYFQLLSLCFNFTFESFGPVTHSFNIIAMYKALYYTQRSGSCQTFWSQDTFIYLKIKCLSGLYLLIFTILEMKTKV